MVVEFHPEALQELLRPLSGQGTILDSLLKKGLQVMVEVARVKRIPSIEFGDHAYMNEPVGLDGLPEVAGRMGWHVLTHISDAQQLFSANRVGFLLGQLACPKGMAASKEDQGVGGDLHRLVECLRENHERATVITRHHDEHDGTVEVGDSPTDLGTELQLTAPHRFG